MSTPSASPAGAEHAIPGRTPVELWEALVIARAEFVRCRQHLPAEPAMSGARSGLLAALEAYVACLAERGQPVPYALRDELRVLRGSQRADRQMRYAGAAPRTS